MANIKMVIVAKPLADWCSLYLDGKFVADGHDISDDAVSRALIHLGHTVDYSYEELTEDCDEKYDGQTLPDDIADLDFA